MVSSQEREKIRRESPAKPLPFNTRMFGARSAQRPFGPRAGTRRCRVYKTRQFTHTSSPCSPSALRQLPPGLPPRTSGPTGPIRELRQPPSRRLPKPGQYHKAEKEDKARQCRSMSADAAAVRLHTGSSYGSEAREDRHDEAVIMAP